MILNKKYMNFIIINLLIVIDLVLLYFIKSNVFLSICYAISNVAILSIICASLDNDTILEIFIFMLLTYSYGVEVLIHYLHRNTFIEMQYLSLIPILFLFFKNNKFRSRIKSFIPFLFFLYVVINIIIIIFSPSISFEQYIKSLLPYIMFCITFYSVKKLNYKFGPICKFILVISIILSTIQFAMNFHQDCRNGIFGLNGISAFAIFVTSISIYYYSLWLRKRQSFVYFVLSAIVAIYVLCIIELKAGIVFYFLSLILIPFFSKKKSLKTIIIMLLFIVLLPFSYKLMLKVNPRFHYLINMEKVVLYFTGNNNKMNYQYGRFESLNIIYKDLSPYRKVFGSGFGSSTPQKISFYTEANRNVYIPYYIRTYGINHGFHLSGLSTLILDGGLIFFVFVVLLLLHFYKKVMLNLRSKDNYEFSMAAIQFNALLFFLYCIIYSNIFTSQKLLAFLAIIVALKPIMFSSADNEIVKERKNEYN